jgi:hypothetical protein
VRSFSKAVNTGLADYHRTAGGRVVVLKFASKAGKPLKSVYLDQIGDTFGTVVRPTRSVFGGGMSGRRATGRTARTAAKKVAKKAATKGTPRQSVRIVAKKVGVRSAGGEIAAGKASAGIPAPIREFAIVFLVNIRKIVCPTGKKKPALSAATTGIVGSLAIWLVRHFGITSEVAETFASALLITVTTATKGTFCDMTAEMVKVALKKA